MASCTGFHFGLTRKSINMYIVYFSFLSKSIKTFTINGISKAQIYICTGLLYLSLYNKYHTCTSHSPLLPKFKCHYDNTCITCTLFGYCKFGDTSHTYSSKTKKFLSKMFSYFNKQILICLYF